MNSQAKNLYDSAKGTMIAYLLELVEKGKFLPDRGASTQIELPDTDLLHRVLAIGAENRVVSIMLEAVDDTDFPMGQPFLLAGNEIMEDLSYEDLFALATELEK